MRASLYLVAVLAGVGAGACAAPPPAATEADAARTGIALGDLQHGRALLLSKCSGCHTTPLPMQHTAADWPIKIDEMAARSHLDGDQKRAIATYLVAFAR